MNIYFKKPQISTDETQILRMGYTYRQGIQGIRVNPCSIRGLKILFLCLSVLSLESLSAEVVSAPVGFLQVTFPASMTTSLSIPLQKNPVAVGPVTSVGATTLTDSNASWTSGQFSTATNPYFVKMVTGSAMGRFYLITANTANQITVDTRGTSFIGLVTVGNRYQIIAAPTLGSLFGTSSVPFLMNASKSSADYLQVWTGSAWQSYWHTGANWRTSGTTANQNNTILYPDEALLVTRRATTPLTIALKGEASMIAEQTEMVGPGNTFAANRYPVNVQIKNLGLLALPNWISAVSASEADRVQIREAGMWVTYWHNGTSWKKGGTTVSQDNALINAGAGYYVLRRSSSASLSAFASQPTPY
jgi:uncharacterized protein (TIGR02597 family)